MHNLIYFLLIQGLLQEVDKVQVKTEGSTSRAANSEQPSKKIQPTIGKILPENANTSQTSQPTEPMVSFQIQWGSTYNGDSNSKILWKTLELLF